MNYDGPKIIPNTGFLLLGGFLGFWLPVILIVLGVIIAALLIRHFKKIKGDQ